MKGRKMAKRIIVAALMLVLALMMFGCSTGASENESAEEPAEEAAEESAEEPAEEAAEESAEEQAEESVEEDAEESAEEPAEETDEESAEEPAEEPVEANGEIYVLYTSDVHCGIDQGFGYAGLKEIKENLESQGYAVILVDNGDSIQGESMGMITKGESIIELMNQVGYDVWTLGNHEFDYGMDQFFKLVDMADFQVISSNLNKEGEMLFPAYTIIEAAGRKIGFVGVTTPNTLVSSTPALFQGEDGEYIYGFLQESTGEAVYTAVQEAVDKARAEGAEFVYLMAHLGFAADDAPWTYADVVEHTTGIDVVFDGHSHDLEHVVMKNKDGDEVTRIGAGTKLNAIGYSHIYPEEGITETDVWVWNNSLGMPELLGIENDVSERIDAEMVELGERLEEVVAKSNITLTIFDPVEKDDKGSPIRMVRRAGTNAGDFCADALRYATGAEIAVINGGGVRADLEKGDVTYGDILTVSPFNNQVALIEATGQQILDALEFGAKAIPGELGGFLQVSGLTYEIDSSIPSGVVEDENGMMIGIEGERRVRNVMVGGEPLDPERTYTVGGITYVLTQNGDGNTAFKGAKVIDDRIKPDSQALIEYIQGPLGGEIGTGYEDPYGDGRIVILE